MIYFSVMETRGIRTSKDIGGLIKKRRKELGISQEGLAETLGVTYQQVQRYENGTNRLNVENIQLIAKALSVPVTLFLWTGIFTAPQKPTGQVAGRRTCPAQTLQKSKAGPGSRDRSSRGPARRKNVDNKVLLGRRIRQLRKIRAMTQEQLGEKAGVDYK